MTIKEQFIFEIKGRIALQKDLLKRAKDSADSARIEGSIDALQGLLNSMDTFSKKSDKSLEKEMDRFFEEMPIQEHENIFEDTYQMIARHFYEFGKNSKVNNMKYYQKFFGHLWMVIKHKAWVFYFACKIGIPVRGFFHDFSKFSPIEFFESVRYYTGISSPIPECKKDKGYSLAWQHHKGRNPHHYEYWMDNFDNGGTPIRIPFKYVVEMTCDWLAAGKSYQGKNFNFADELKWWKVKRTLVQKSMHPAIILFFDGVFDCMARENKIPNKKELRYIYNQAVITFKRSQS